MTTKKDGSRPAGWLTSHPLAIMIAERLGRGLITLFIVSLIIFFGVSLLPGDFATAVLGQGASQAAIAALRVKLGLDVPAYLRYGRWLFGMLHGDLGYSILAEAKISDMVDVRLFNTFFLAGYAAAMAIPLAVALGIVAALHAGKWLDRLINIILLGAISFPEFFIAYTLILFFAVYNEWFPSLSQVGDGTSLVERLYLCFLPALAMSMVIMAHIMRMTRAAIINVLHEPFVEMARLKGVRPWRLVVQHALPNALAPIINVIAINMAYLVVGVVLVEVVFVYPGLGQLLVDSVSRRDLPVVQAASMIFGATYILLNLVADLLIIVTNPRLFHRR